MTTFDISVAMKIIPEFNGDHKKFTNFCNIVEYLYDPLDTENKPKLLKFVLKTKISDTVRSKLIGLEVPVTFNEFKLNFQKVLKQPKSSLMIQSELSRLTQRNSTVTEYAAKIEELIADLNYLQINQQGNQHRDIIVKMNDEIGLHAFKSGLADPLKNIVFAARPSNLNDAIHLALESEIPVQENHSVMAFNPRKNFDRRPQGPSKFCNYCKKKGHEIKECFKKKRVEAKKVHFFQNPENCDAPKTEDSGN